MASFEEIKERETPECPIFLFDCEFANGRREYWSERPVKIGAVQYQARVVDHTAFEMKAVAEDGIDGFSRIGLALSNADSYCSQLERAVGFKGARLKVSFCFYNWKSRREATAPLVLFQGVGEPAVEISESVCRLRFASRLVMQRVVLPQLRIQRRCPWTFPATASARREAVNGGEKGRFSPYFQCGYSADQEGGVGNLQNGQVFTSCDYSRRSCEERGMFSRDENQRLTARFGGIEFVPATSIVRGFGDASYRVSQALENTARYNDCVPIVYGTAWVTAPVVFAKNDGNLTRIEALVSIGPIEGVLKVVVAGYEIPLGNESRDMSGTGWYNVVTLGDRTGGFNLMFTDGSNRPLGDPYGGMCYLAIAVPNRVNDGRSLPRVDVLVEGLRIAEFGEDGTFLRESFNNNPAWVLLDVLRRIGWSLGEVDVPSFARAAQYCGELVEAQDVNGSRVRIPRYQCNLALVRRMNAADVIRGIRNCGQLFLRYGWGGLLEVAVEGTIAQQQPVRRSTSNSSSPIGGGWPAYEFGDGTYGFSGILRREDGRPAIRLFSRSTAEVPNRYSVEFQDAFNGYQQDSFSLVDAEDVSTSRQEVTTTLPALGIANVDQAARLCRLQLMRSVFGNQYVEFDTSMRGLGLWPGDIISVTYLREGLDRDLFRIVKIAPHENFATATITAQVHDDDWYVTGATREQAARRRLTASLGLPRPLGGIALDEYQQPVFAIEEEAEEEGDGSASVSLLTTFQRVERPASSRAGMPQLSLAVRIGRGNGGSLRGPNTYYYAIAGVDGDGVEGELSFVARAELGGGEDFDVRLQDLRFPAGTERFHVYRGLSPAELQRLQRNLPIAAEFVDTGLPALLGGPPDPNYDHANFYWRTEQVPPTQCTTAGANRIGSAVLSLSSDEFKGSIVRIFAGRGAGQERVIQAHDATTFVVSRPWTVVPDTSSMFAVAEPTWHFAGTTRTDRIRFRVHNRPGVTVHVLGLSANARDEECSPEISIVTRHTIAGAAGSLLDDSVPPPPSFGVTNDAKGVVTIAGLGFGTLQNTRSISGLTARVYYWDEWQGPTRMRTTHSIAAIDTSLRVQPVVGLVAGSYLQVGSEIIRIVELAVNGAEILVERGCLGSTAALHEAESQVYLLSISTSVFPIVKDFFGSPASGTWSQRIEMPGVRVVAIELYATNSRGNGPVTVKCFTETTDNGLRTGQGGQTTLTVNGTLAIQAGAGQSVVLGEAKVIRDIFATVSEAPTGAPIELGLYANSALLAQLTIPNGSKISNIIAGRDLGPLQEMTQLRVDIFSVPGSGTGYPGRDLSVIIRH